MVTVAVALAPLSMTCEGEMLQVIFVVPPPQDSATLPVKPLSGEIVKVVLPECDRATVSDDGDEETLKSEICCERVVEELPTKSVFVEATVATIVCVPTANEAVE